MGYEINPSTGNLDKVGLSESDADALYLRLDTANKPLTGALTTDDGSLLATAVASGILTLGGTGGTNNENLTFDFETTANEVAIGTGAGVTTIDFGTLAIDVPEIANRGGDLKIEPDIQGDVVLFGDTDVGVGADSKKLTINRRAASYDGSMSFYMDGTTEYGKWDVDGRFGSIVLTPMQRYSYYNGSTWPASLWGRNSSYYVAMNWIGGPAGDGTDDYALFSTRSSLNDIHYTAKSHIFTGDNVKLFFGAGKDVKMEYDGVNWIFNPKVVGTGYMNIQGQLLMDDKVMFTQTDGNEYIDSLTDGDLDLEATTAVNLRINGTEEFELTATQLDLKSNNLTTTGAVNIGSGSVGDDRLVVTHSPVNDNLAHAFVPIYTPTYTATGTYNNYCMSFAAQFSADTGIKNNGAVIALLGNSLTTTGSEGDFADLRGMSFQYGNNAGIGTIDDAYGIHIRPLAKTGLIKKMYNIFMQSAATGGTITSPYDMKTLTGWDWWFASDNQKIRLGATEGDCDLFSDGTNAQLDSTGDIYLNPSGNVKFGTHTGIGAESLSGYITVKDSAGNSRKLAVVS